MHKPTMLIAALVLSFSAHAGPPSDASVVGLLDAMQAKAMGDAAMVNMESMMRQSMAATPQGKTMTDKQQAHQDLMVQQITQMAREELSWEKMRPLYIKIYQDSFSQEDVDGLVAFYRSPAGIAYVNKMPIAMQKTMNLVQSRMGPMVEKIQAIIAQAIADEKKTQ